MENKCSVLVTTATGRTGQSLIENLHHHTQFNSHVFGTVRNAKSKQSEYIKSLGASLREVHFPALTSHVQLILNDSNSPREILEDTLQRWYEQDWINQHLQFQLDAALKDIEYIYLNAPFDELNFLICKSFIDAAMRAKKSPNCKLKYIIKMSGLMCDKGAKTQHHARQHQLADNYLLNSGIPCTILRPNTFCQNFFYDSYMEAIKKHSTIKLPLENKVSYIDVRDISDVIISLIQQDLIGNLQYHGKTFDVTGPEALGPQDLANIFSQVLKKPITFTLESREEAYTRLKQSGLSDGVISRQLQIYQTNVDTDEVDPGVILPTTEQLLGKLPRNFSQFVTDYAHVFLD